MVNEVESILDEIRERVRSDHEQSDAPVTFPVSAETAKTSLAPVKADSDPRNSESLNRLSAHLTTTARAWDRLPPLYSNRRGSAARLELWLKARLKSMSRWFTWEQVNFNSAVHHALAETLHALSASQQELAGLRAELHSETESWRERFAESARELSALRAGIETLTAEVRKRNAILEARTDAHEANLEAHSANLEARSTAIEAQAAELAGTMWKEIEATRSGLAELARELRENDLELREEQRVCFKQLSLAASEAAVMEDRSRRAIESRMDELQKALSNGEK